MDVSWLLINTAWLKLSPHGVVTQGSIIQCTLNGRLNELNEKVPAPCHRKIEDASSVAICLTDNSAHGSAITACACQMNLCACRLTVEHKMDHFVKAVRRGITTLSTAESALSTMVVVDKILESAGTGPYILICAHTCTYVRVCGHRAVAGICAAIEAEYTCM